MAGEDKTFEQAYDRAAYEAFLNSLPKAPPVDREKIRVFKGGTTTRVVPVTVFEQSHPGEPLDKAYC